MLKITSDVEEIIENYIQNGQKKREAIFYAIIANDEELEKITRLYRERKTVDEIIVEGRIPAERVREGIDVITHLNRLIDKKINSSHYMDYYEKRAIEQNLPHSNKEELYRSTTIIRKQERLKKENASKKLTKIISEYQSTKINSKGNSENVRKFVNENIDEVVELNNLLGYNASRLLYIASMYNDLGNYKKTNVVLSRINKDNMSATDAKNYGIVRRKAIKLENADFIKKLYKKRFK